MIRYKQSFMCFEVVDDLIILMSSQRQPSVANMTTVVLRCKVVSYSLGVLECLG